MKRTRIFTLIMAIFWTIIAAAVIVLAMRSELTGAMRFLLVSLALVAAVGNWLRWSRSR